MSSTFLLFSECKYLIFRATVVLCWYLIVRFISQRPQQVVRSWQPLHSSDACYWGIWWLYLYKMPTIPRYPKKIQIKNQIHLVFFSFESFRAPAIDAWPFSHGSETCIRIVTLAYYNPYQWAVQSPIFSKFRAFPAQNSPFASEVQRGWHQKLRQLVKQPLSKGFLARSYTKASWSNSSLYSSSSRSSTGTLSPMLVLLAT